jgi:hypothetical protein
MRTEAVPGALAMLLLYGSFKDHAEMDIGSRMNRFRISRD